MSPENDAKVFRLPTQAAALLDSAEPGDLTTVVEEFPAACACGSAFWSGVDGGEPAVMYGLGGGGMGAYMLCSACDRITKILDPEDES